MPIFSGNWEGPLPGTTWMKHVAASVGVYQGHTCRTIHTFDQGKPHHFKPYQAKNMDIFGTVMRHWRWTLEASDQYYWDLYNRHFDNRRNQYVYKANPLLRFVNVQLPIMDTLGGPTFPEEAGYPPTVYQIQELAAYEWSQLVWFRVPVKQEQEPIGRMVLHLHAIPLRYTGKSIAWRYAKWIKSVELSSTAPLGETSYQWINGKIPFPIKDNDKLNIFLRFTTIKNTPNGVPPPEHWTSTVAWQQPVYTTTVQP